MHIFLLYTKDLFGMKENTRILKDASPPIGKIPMKLFIINMFATELLGITKLDVSAVVARLMCIKNLVSLGCNLNDLFNV
jgi:hypothetical protein